MSRTGRPPTLPPRPCALCHNRQAHCGDMCRRCSEDARHTRAGVRKHPRTASGRPRKYAPRLCKFCGEREDQGGGACRRCANERKLPTSTNYVRNPERCEASAAHLLNGWPIGAVCPLKLPVAIGSIITTRVHGKILEFEVVWNGT